MRRTGARRRPWGRSGGPGVLGAMAGLPIALLLVSAATLIGSGDMLRRNAVSVLQRVSTHQQRGGGYDGHGLE